MSGILRFDRLEAPAGDGLALGVQLVRTGLAALHLRGDVAEGLRALALRLGPIYPHRDADALGFTWIEPRDGERLADGDRGFSHGALAAHTETSGSPRPPEFVALASIVPATEGGECLLVDGRGIARSLRGDTEVWDALCDPRAACYRSGTEEWTGPVVEIANGWCRWRFRSDPLATWAPAMERVLPRVLEAVEKHTYEVALGAGQALVANNGWWLHGRCAFSGPRRMVRVLVGSGPDAAVARDLRGFPLD